MVLPEFREDPILRQFLWPSSSDQGLPLQLREPEPKLLTGDSLPHHDLANRPSSISLVSLLRDWLATPVRKVDSCSKEELT